MNEEELKIQENRDESLSAASESSEENGPLPAESNASEKNEVAEEKSEAELLTEKYNELNDKYLRLYSDFENFRKRTTKERIELYKTAGEDVINSLLPVIDDFERALKAVKDTNDLKSLKEGVELIHQKFEKTLIQKGLKSIESAVGKDFDINFHEAITRIPAPEPDLKGKVIDEVEKGYTLNDKVIRYTKVVIGE